MFQINANVSNPLLESIAMTAFTFLPDRTAVAIATASVFSVGAVGAYRMVRAENTPSVQAPLAATANPAPAGLPDLASIAKRYGPAVDNISVNGTRKVGTNGADDSEDENEDDSNGGSADDGNSASGNNAPSNGARQDFLRRF